MPTFSPLPQFGDDNWVAALKPGCPNCKELFKAFSDAEAKRSFAVGAVLPYWRSLVKEALDCGDLQTRPQWKEWIERAERALGDSSG